jgi:hypothetical protein
MTQPTGFVVPGQESKVCRLQHSLYGLRQSGRCWNEKLNAKFLAAGLIRCKSDPCVYYISTKKGLVIVFVDDLTVLAENAEAMKLFKALISDLFETKDLGELHYLLGIKIEQESDGSVYLSQKKYAEAILERFGMQDCKPVATPFDVSHHLSKQQSPTTEKERLEMLKYPYRELVGSIMYLAQCTRPDLAYAASKLGQFSSNPGMDHWVAGKRVLRYLCGTLEHRLCFKKGARLLEAYCDADWAGDTDDRRSYSGYCLRLGSSLAIWRATKQPCVATSTMEAEYIALAACVKEVLWSTTLLRELGMGDLIGSSAQIRCDNQAAIISSTDQVPRSKSKHIDIRYHFVRDAVNSGAISVTYVASADNIADLLTKPLARAKHKELASSLGLVRA